ncbi:MAG: PhzF family phenazine biosynthesis protein [Acidimicrobiales bacterium]|nr:PhzF family phenazine biosynthesis protein [Acidimicrobiales bacterium]
MTWIVDAFAEGRFSGNQAGVCILDSPIDEIAMLSIANELGFSETAFVEGNDKRISFDLRWFTPSEEVDLCGHATLGAAFVVFELGLVEVNRIHFSTKSGVISVERENDGYLSLTLGKENPMYSSFGREQVSEMLGVEVLGLFESKRDLFAEVSDFSNLKNINPDLDRIAALPFRALVVTCGPHEGVSDYSLRVFGPKVSIPEDSATGSVQAVLGPYWSDRLGKYLLEVTQLSSRGGKLRVKVGGDSVIVQGKVVLFMKGTIELKE